MNEKRKRKLIIMLPLLVILLFWMTMVITDYFCSEKAQPPVFARKLDNVADADIYQGLGYRIILDDGYAVAPPDAELKGFFYWGWS